MPRGSYTIYRMIPMGDGINLAANISKPKTEGRYPVVLVRTPYGKDNRPLSRTKYVNHYFDSEGKANSLDGDGSLSLIPAESKIHDKFTYDPENPVKTKGGPILFYDFGTFDQKDAETRKDVLVYTSDVIESELEVTGPVKVVLYASTDGKDTDWTAKLVDVYPDGRAFNLCEGIIRARFNENPAKPVLIKPNKINIHHILYYL